MVTALAEGAMTVTELAEAMGIHQTTASYHCSLLEAAGLIVVQPSGNRRYISLRARELRVRFGPQGDTGHS
jgi:DNA-binding transcriptional ArsR family regulator